jgi:multidrug resistance efflux pump
VAATPPANLTPRKKRIWLVYGILSTCYIVFVVTLFVFFVFRFFMNKFPEIGIFLGAYGAYLILRKRINKFMDFSRFVILDKRELFQQKASVRRWGLVGSVLLLVLLFYPFGRTVSGPAVIEPARILPLRAESSGFLAEVAADGNALLPAGTLVARLRNPDVVAGREKAQAEFDRLRAAAGAALAAGDMAAYQARLREQDAAAKDLAEWQRQESRLVLRAPFDGYVLTERMQDLVGKFVRPGELLCEFGALQSVRARIRVNEFVFRDVADGRAVRLKLNSYPAETFSGVVTRRGLASPDAYDAAGRTTDLVRVAVAPGTKSEPTPFAHFEILAELSNPDLRLRPGMTGNAKISTDRRSLAGRLFRSAADLFRSKVWW